MNSTQAFDLHDVDAYLICRNRVDDRHRSYCLRWLKCCLSGFCGADHLSPVTSECYTAWLYRMITTLKGYFGYVTTRSFPPVEVVIQEDGSVIGKQ
jgi:hypothetical protein